MKRQFLLLFVALLLATLSSWATVLNVPGTYPTIQTAVSAAVSGDEIQIAAGTFPIGSTVAINVPNLTITGAGIGSTFITGDMTAGANFFQVLAANFKLQNVEIIKTDKAGVQNLIWINASNASILNSSIHGQFVIGEGDVSRALTVSGGHSGLLINGNTFYALRQPGYFSGPTTGIISNNNTYGTKGWVLEGGDMTFTGNTWGVNVYDIAILSAAPAAAYLDIVAMSNANNGAVIEDQRVIPAVLSVVYVDASTAFTTDLGGKYHPYPSITTAAIDRVVPGGTIYVADGNYNVDVNINKSLKLIGEGMANTIISGPIGGGGSTIQVGASNVLIEGFTITRDGNNPTDWNNSALNSAGIAVQGLTAFAEIRNNTITKMRTAIDINNSNGNNIHNNIITDNRTGMIMRNQTDNMQVTDNTITNNWTVGILFLDASSGSNVPVQTAANCVFAHNNLSGNWYGQVVDRQTGGSLPTPGANLKNFENNYWGTLSPVVSTANSTEPGYSAQIPVSCGGTAVAPGGQPDILGAASANIDYTPWCNSTFTICDFAPIITTIGTPIPTTCGTFDVPVTVKDFKNVGAISLSLNYATELNYQGVTLNSAIESATAEAFTPGLFKLSWGGGVSGITINDNDVLFTLHFNLPTATKGSTTFTWDNSNCEIAGPGSNDPVIYTSIFNNLTATFPTRPVKNTNTGWEYCTIQAAIDDALTLATHTITVDGTFYAAKEQVLVNKEVTIKGINGQPTVEFLGTVSGKPTLFDISANNVTIENIHFNVDLAKLRSAIIATSADIDNITVKNNVIDCYGTPSGSYGERNAVSVNYAGYRVATGGVDNIVFTDNTVNAGTYPIMFRSGISVDEGEGTFSGNTLKTISADILVRFANSGNVNVSGNHANGGGMEFADFNAGSGTLSITGNDFDGTWVNAQNIATLRLKNNYTARPTFVSSNAFTAFTWGVSLENFQTITLNANTFTPLANSITYRHITLNTKDFSSSSGFYAPVVGAIFTNNIFNGSGSLGGTALAFYNWDNDSPVFNAITIGTVGNENTFNDGIGKFIVLDGSAGSVAPNATTMVPWAVNLDAQNNLFASTLPSAMTLTQLFALEDKIDHKIDLASLGFVTVKANNDYVTINSFVAPNTTPLVQRGIDAASSGWTVNVDAGTYNENVDITKAISLKGANAGVACASGRGAESIIIGSANIAVAISSDNVSINGFTIKNPLNSYGIYAKGRNLTDIQYNVITDIGNNTSGSGASYGVAIEMGSAANIDDVKISNNCISNIRGGENTSLTGSTAKSNNGSAAAIGIGWSDANFDITKLVVENNIISGNAACIKDFAEGGKGAYGVLIGVGAKSNAAGKAVSSKIWNNEISNLEGWWAHGIGLEGDTPGASVLNNMVSNLIGHKTTPDATGVVLEQNDGAGSVVINNNSFTGVQLGIANVSTGMATANCNWYGSPISANVVAKVYGPVTSSPWLTNGFDNSTSVGFQPVSGSCDGTPVVVDFVSKNDETCLGSANGAIDVTISGGKLPYSIVWTNTATSEDLTNLPVGTYNVVVTDFYGSTGTLASPVVIGTVPDLTAPTILGTIAPITVEGCAASSAPTAVTSVVALEALGLAISDNCALNPVVTSLDAAVGTCPIVVTRTYTVKDAIGNGNTVAQTITITHLTAPTQVGGPVASASTVECESAALAPTTLPLVQDVCDNVLTPGAPIKQVSFTNKFDAAVALGAAPAWYTDRYNPAGFASSSFNGDNRLKHSISAADGASSRPAAYSSAFYNTQGRSFDVGLATDAIEVKLYIPAEWATSNKRMAGLWGVAVDATNSVSGYPIVEFTSDGGPRFRAYDNGTYVDMGLPAGFVYDSWVTLKIKMLPSKEFLLSAGSLSYVTKGLAAANSVRLKSVILQGHNYDAVQGSIANGTGVSYDIYWDDFTWNDAYSAIACEGAITYTYNYADCAGLPYIWTYTYTIDHVTAPVVPADGALTVECIASAVAPALPTVTDICGTTLTPELVSTVDSPSLLVCEGTRTYNYKYTDCSGLVSNWKYVYTIQHTTAPSVLTSAPTNGGTVECTSAATAPTTLPVVKDVCGNILEPIGAPTVGGTYAGCEGTYTYTYNYKDCANLNFAWTYSYTIDHTTVPVVPANGAKTVACLSSAIDPTLVPTVADQQQLQVATDLTTPNWTDFTSIGQSFTSGTSGKLTQLDLRVGSLAGAQNFTLQIYQGNGISGTLLYTGSHSLTATGWQSLNIAQNDAPYLTAGQQYTFWLTAFTYNQLGLLCMHPDVYSGGVAMDGCTSGCSPAYAWQQWPAFDLVFKTYMSVLPVVTDVCNNVIATPTPTVEDAITNCAGTRTYTYNYVDCSGLSTPWVYTYTIAPVDFSLPANGTSTVACVSNVVTPTPPSVNDACGNPMTPVAGTAPIAPACEGTMVYSWTYTDCAGHNHVWTHTVTIDDNIAPTISFTPADITVNMNSGCTATGVNLGTLLATDNCNGVVNITNNAPTAFPAGETIVTWTVKDCALNSVTSTQKVTVVSNTLSGTMVYNNASGAKTPMSNVELTLSKAGSVVATKTTELNGSYSFAGLCAGEYTIAVTGNAKPLGGINATDALGVNYWSAYFGSIEQVKFMAGDVSMDNNFMDATDALTIQKSFVKPTVFDRAPWSYWKQGDMIQNNASPYSIIDPAHPWPTDIKVSVNGDVANFNLYAMVTGDFNGSFRPDVTKSASWTMELNNSNVMNVVANQAFELPIRAASAMQVSAVSMILNVQSKLVSVQEVLVNGSTAPVSWAVIGDELRIAWNSLTPVQVSENGNLLTLKLKTTNAFTVDQTMDISLKFDPLNELADGNLEVINGANLLVAQVTNGNGITGLIDPTENSGLSFNNYPNPFRSSTTVDYKLPVSGKVTIDVYNQIGQLVQSLVNANQNAGNYSIRMDANSLMPGIYIAKLRLTNTDVDMTGTVKLSVLK